MNEIIQNVKGIVEEIKKEVELFVNYIKSDSFKTKIENLKSKIDETATKLNEKVASNNQASSLLEESDPDSEKKGGLNIKSSKSESAANEDEWNSIVYDRNEDIYTAYQNSRWWIPKLTVKYSQGKYALEYQEMEGDTFSTDFIYDNVCLMSETQLRVGIVQEDGTCLYGVASASDGKMRVTPCTYSKVSYLYGCEAVWGITKNGEKQIVGKEGYVYPLDEFKRYQEGADQEWFNSLAMAMMHKFSDPNSMSYTQNSEGKYEVVIKRGDHQNRTGFVFDSAELLNDYNLRVSQIYPDGTIKYGLITVFGVKKILPCCFDEIKPYTDLFHKAYIGEDAFYIHQCGWVFDTNTVKIVNI